MTNDNLYTPYRGPKWEIGKLSIGFHSHEDILALAESFIETESFLDAVGYILKRVDVVFGLRPVTQDGILSFLDPPPKEEQVAVITHKLVAVYLAWQIARDWNPAVAAFKADTLEDLRNEIHRVNRDAIDAAQNGTELQKVAAAYNSRKDITAAFYRMNRELSIHQAKYDFLRQVSDQGGVEHGGTDSRPSGEDHSLNVLNAEVKPTSDANLPTITISVTPTDSVKSNRKGVSLQDAARAANDDAPELWSETKKSWQQSHRKHHLPTPIGKAESHTQMDLYDLNELCDAIAKLETREQAEFCRERLRHKLQDVARAF
jgi:hypothetical protein